MSEQAKSVPAAVLTAAGTLGIQAFPVPRLGEDDALIRVEVCGLGGSDVTQYLGKLRPSSTVYPVILGHVFVGTVESVGPRAARRWRVAPGDRVVAEAIVPSSSSTKG
jgi:alcohol dehydrogenase